MKKTEAKKSRATVPLRIRSLGGAGRGSTTKDSIPGRKWPHRGIESSRGGGGGGAVLISNISVNSKWLYLGYESGVGDVFYSNEKTIHKKISCQCP
jgi:hypothetical protein